MLIWRAAIIHFPLYAFTSVCIPTLVDGHLGCLQDYYYFLDITNDIAVSVKKYSSFFWLEYIIMSGISGLLSISIFSFI